MKGGRCENCQGDGMIKIEMHFLADAYAVCEVCQGKRYNRETLEITYKGKNIADVLAMTVDEASRFFRNVPTVSDKLSALQDVGLGYLRLGQNGNTLSGGEAQRVKLATELSKKATGRTLYILDEPTTGLHFADIEKLLQVLMKLRDAGNTLVVIEHNLEMIKCADWVIDLGPEGGAGGGRDRGGGNAGSSRANERQFYRRAFAAIVRQMKSWRGLLLSLLFAGFVRRDCRSRMRSGRLATACRRSRSSDCKICSGKNFPLPRADPRTDETDAKRWCAPDRPADALAVLPIAGLTNNAPALFLESAGLGRPLPLGGSAAALRAGERTRRRPAARRSGLW